MSRDPLERYTVEGEIRLPDIPEPLISALEALFPDRAPGPDESLDRIRFQSGQVHVVRFLRTHFNKQNGID